MGATRIPKTEVGLGLVPLDGGAAARGREGVPGAGLDDVRGHDVAVPGHVVIRPSPAHDLIWCVPHIDRMTAAYESRLGRTASRGSDGTPKIARATPAEASASSSGFFGGAKKMETGTDRGSRPARASRSRRAGMRSTGLRPGLTMGIQPSHSSATRSKVVGPSPPMRIGGWGFWTGLGSDQMGSKFTWSP